ncbi:sugar ABC transporter substrate-binding protein [Streptosporangium nondiastaticum]|uniref:Sugar ABC transporter substrate-binding protein n=1 Tax=Streptosporangium nondiastaticum TaxID=35764 RepID=A0A9X7JQB1_9ACTN|nr:extracellular solute-binding protein [Streptosporangium nondiastaticum]PSJ27763.1 sugar ABC transporter substrate-binding protein [Streptosporangium nondiastaticum]
MRPATPALLAVAALAAASLTACGEGSGGGDPDTVRIAYQRNTDNKNRIVDDYLAGIKRQFERAHEGKKLELVPIQAAQADYFAKLQQMMRSPKTAPDVVREDTFLIKSDIKAGYLRPLDDKLAGWKDWARFVPAAKASAQGQDGKTYGVPDGTDTRALWFNKEIFARAGLPADWHPRTWNDVLDAARTVAKKVPGVTPLNVYTGKAAGEAAAMQGFEMLLYGTGKDPLYDPAARKWVTSSRGFRDALEFVRTVYAEKLGPDPADALAPNVDGRVATDWLPSGKLAIDLDGSWMGKYWQPAGTRPWPRWTSVMGRVPFPTQNGAAPGAVSMSGGWAWAVSARSAKADLAWQAIETLQTTENATTWTVSDGQIAVRDDVAASHKYLSSMPGVDFFTGLVPYTHYRPALPLYPQVSSAIRDAMEAVTTGDATVVRAAKRYDEELKSVAGAPGVTARER